jgi:hypothetical protein
MTQNASLTDLINDKPLTKRAIELTGSGFVLGRLSFSGVFVTRVYG